MRKLDMSFLKVIWERIFYLPSIKDKERERVARAILGIFIGCFGLAVVTISYYLINGIWLHGILLTGVVITGIYSLRYIRQDQFEYAFILFFSVCDLFFYAKLRDLILLIAAFGSIRKLLAYSIFFAAILGSLYFLWIA